MAVISAAAPPSGSSSQENPRHPREGRIISLFTACSLDGFIATEDGGIDWLFHDQDYGFSGFFAGVDTALCGRKTYDLSMELASDPFPGKRVFVFTRSGRHGTEPGVEFIRDDPAAFSKSLKMSEGGKIWLVGGGEINSLLMKAGLVDEMVVSIHPVVLGAGRPLFGVNVGTRKYKLERCENFPSGLAQLTYRLPK